MARLLVYVKCTTQTSLIAQVKRAIERTASKYAKLLNFKENGFNIEIPEEKLWTFLLSIMRDGIIVENVQTLAKKAEKLHVTVV